MIKVGLVGLGKMGISHFSLINANPNVEAVLCDASGYILEMLKKHTGCAGYKSYDEMLDKESLDAVVISTPSKMHAPMVEQALNKGLHVFCEKPLCLDPADSERLGALAKSKGLVTQVGYHYRYVGAFQELKRVIENEALGRITHVIAEAYGPVVLKPKGKTWRTDRTEGGGCLFDYGAHPINLLNWYFGEPTSVGASILESIFSTHTDDAVYSTLKWDNGVTAQLSVNWSDESYRKMATKLSLVGTNGRVNVDRQECQVYLREPVDALPGYEAGWNVKYTTDMTSEVDFYLRGEEYSAQMEDFVSAITKGDVSPASDFQSAAQTDRTLQMIIENSNERGENPSQPQEAEPAKRRGWLKL